MSLTFQQAPSTVPAVSEAATPAARRMHVRLRTSSSANAQSFRNFSDMNSRMPLMAVFVGFSGVDTSMKWTVEVVLQMAAFTCLA